MRDLAHSKPRLAAMASVALLLCIVMLPNVLWLISGGGIIAAVAGLAIPSLLLALLFALCGKRVWIACLFLTPFALLTPLECFYIFEYRHPSSADVIASIFATNTTEAQGFFGRALFPLVVAAAASFVLALVSAWLAHRARLQWRGRLRNLTLLAVISLPVATIVAGVVRTSGGFAERLASGAAVATRIGESISFGFPFGAIERSTSYYGQWRALQNQVATLKSFRFGATRSSALPQRQIYVLIIGESSRRDHWQLFGYDRPTNPELSKIENLVPLSDMVTSWPISVMAIPLTITRKPIDSTEMFSPEPSILRAMEEAGFQTHWISNQMPIGKLESPVSVYALEAQHVTFLNHASSLTDVAYDEALIKPLDEAVHASNADLFVVLHMMGSHILYDRRYPDAFKIYRPTLSETAAELGEGMRTHNSYDNTILYTDYVVSKVIGTLQSTASVSALLYVSDHGETLPSETCNFAGHGVGSRDDFQIPALFWFSDAYALARSSEVAAIKHNGTQRTLSASTFESIIDMAGVTFPGHDKRWSLFSDDWQYHPRTINSYADRINYDIATFDKVCGAVESFQKQ